MTRFLLRDDTVNTASNPFSSPPPPSPPPPPPPFSSTVAS